MTLDDFAQSVTIDRTRDRTDTTEWTWDQYDSFYGPDVDPGYGEYQWWWKSSDRRTASQIDHDVYHYDSSHSLGDEGQAVKGTYSVRDERRSEIKNEQSLVIESESFYDATASIPNPSGDPVYYKRSRKGVRNLYNVY